jgi:RND superfamily putative drug exporter
VQAVGRTIEFTGPTVATAGAGLALAMVAASQLLPGGIVMSVSIAVVTASVLSVLSAVLVVPAILLLLGPRLDRWAWPRRTGDRGMVMGLTARLSRRPRAVVLPVVLGLLALALWAFSLDTGIGSVALLPANDPGRRQQEDVQRALGPGWIAPYEIVMQGGDEPVTTPDRLHQLASFQRRVEDDPGVASMTGFAGIERATRRLGGLGRELADQQKGLKRLGDGLGRAHEGAVLNTNGLLQAADGARQLDTGVLAAGSGAGQLAEGLTTASAGSTRLSGGLDRASEGSGSLADGAVKASSGAHRLSDGLSRAQERTGEMVSSARVLENAMDLGDSRLAELESTVATTESQLAASLAALRAMTSGRTDPQYAPALEAAEAATASLTGTDPASGDPSADAQGVNAGIDGARGQFSLGSYLSRRLRKNGRQASDGITKLARGSSRLDSGLAKLADGSRQVSVGIDRLSRGGQALAPGLQRLSSGAGQLASGLGQLRTGSTALASGLGGGAQKSKLLAGALHKIGSGVERQADEGSASASPPQGMFRSGYFYLASIDGSSAERRGRAGFLVSLDRGGHAARMLVIPRHTPSEPEAAETQARIERDADRLARLTGTTVVVGGATPAQLEIDDAFRDQAPLARLILALVTVIILVPLLRSLIVPVIAALLNVLTVAATFGLLALFFDGSFLGGPGFVDTTVIPATIMVIFGLAIDYEVFIFSRMREEYLRTGSAEAAIVEGLNRTAPVVTGAAVIMIAVFLAFATSSFSTIRGFGVAQAVAVAIDAFAIRLVVIPAVMRALGSRAWWIPRWLDRLLPGGGASPAPAEGGAR